MNLARYIFMKEIDPKDKLFVNVTYYAFTDICFRPWNIIQTQFSMREIFSDVLENSERGKNNPGSANYWKPFSLAEN